MSPTVTITKKQKKIEDISIRSSDSMLKALKRMDSTLKRLLLVFEGSRFLNVLSIGDIQRAIIRNEPLSTPVEAILRQDTIVAHTSDTAQKIGKRMLECRIECMPVLNDAKELADVYFWEDIFVEKEKQPPQRFNIPVVVMAGGFGTRLKPLTNVIPKPLIPIGQKTMLEEIFDRFARHGCDAFFLSVNYKSELIKYYLSCQGLPYEIDYFIEDKPLGTAGSLTLLKGKIHQTFFVNNCDILIEEDYAEILKYHHENKNEITLVAALKTYPIPYGTIDTGHNGALRGIREKPELTFKINSGMYILEPHLLDEIPEGDFFHITDLIHKVKARDGKVGVFPVSEGSWKDIGNWEQYLSKINVSNGL